MKNNLKANIIGRKRGRPAGNKRAPLSAEERRARNAQYERERRIETSEAMEQLKSVAGCLPSASNADVLATVVNYLQEASARHPSEELESLRRQNQNLMMQMETLNQRIASDPKVKKEASTSDTASSNLSKSDDGDRITHTHSKGASSFRLLREMEWKHFQQLACEQQTPDESNFVLPDLPKPKSTLE